MKFTSMIFALVALVASTASAERVVTPVTSSSLLTVVSTNSTLVDPKVDLCPTCIQFTGEAINELLNYILNAGVVGGCSKLCSILPSADQGICDIICDLVGIQAFINALNNTDIDPIYFCEEVGACKPGPDDAAATVTGVTASPKGGPVGTTFDLSVMFDVTKATGVGEIQLAVDGGFISIGQGFVNEGFPVGKHALSVKLQAQNDPNADPPVEWDVGAYEFEFEMCQGECGSKHPHSKVFGTAKGIFNITEN